MKLKGGPELRARLASVIAARPEIARAWSKEAAVLIEREAPRRSGKLASSIAPGEKAGKGVVRGAWYGVIVDRGTKAYGISAKPGSTLRFNYRGRTIFAKSVKRKRLRRRPFITRGAQDALRTTAITHEIIRAYSRRRSGGRFGSVAL